MWNNIKYKKGVSKSLLDKCVGEPIEQQRKATLEYRAITQGVMDRYGEFKGKTESDVYGREVQTNGNRR